LPIIQKPKHPQQHHIPAPRFPFVFGRQALFNAGYLFLPFGSFADIEKSVKQMKHF